jgi:hypothetical protein
MGVEGLGNREYDLPAPNDARRCRDIESELESME